MTLIVDGDQDMPKGLAAKLKQSLYFPDKYPVIFVNNAKVACTTIKKSMWVSSSPETFLEASNPHNRVQGPFANSLRAALKQHGTFDNLCKFGLVRNPYSRFLSAYKDKIARSKRDLRVWKKLVARYGFAASSQPSMEDMLRCIRDDDPHQVDQHFALQTINLSIGLIRFDYLGQLEDFEETRLFLQDFGIEVSSHLRHSTGSVAIADLRSELSAECIALIEEIYASDFAEFGYSVAPDSVQPIAKVKLRDVDDRILITLVRMITARNPERYLRLEQALVNLGADVDADALRSELSLEQA